MTEASLNKLTKTQVLFPKDIEELVHRIRGFHALAVFFFTRSSFISQGLKKVVNFCMDNKMLLKTRFFMDDKFIAKFITAIDERVFQWLKQCSNKDSVVTRTFRSLNFHLCFLTSSSTDSHIFYPQVYHQSLSTRARRRKIVTSN